MKALRVLSTVLSLLAMALGGLLGLWSLVCLLGGPDGNFGEPVSFLYAAVFAALAALVFIPSRKWFRWSMKRLKRSADASSSNGG